MDPITLLVAAIAAAAGAAGKTIVTEAVKDTYNALKKRLHARYNTQPDLGDALQKVEADPASEPRQAVLREELAKAHADEDEELQQLARALIDRLKEENLLPGPTYQAYQTGSGALAQGEGNTVAGQGGIAVGGNLQGTTDDSATIRRPQK